VRTDWHAVRRIGSMTARHSDDRIVLNEHEPEQP